MDAVDDLTRGQNIALVIFAFLQADCKNSEYKQELCSLGQEIQRTPDINCNGLRQDDDSGNLETDGHQPQWITAFDDIQPSVEFQRPENDAGLAAIRQVAEELREIAANLEHNVVAQATHNLRRNIEQAPNGYWNHLSRQVDEVMQGVSLKDLPQERVIVAVTLTLVKGVCEQAPRLLKCLFSAALQYISGTGSR
ncbi:uncharacterized protein V6R79_012341 [Siganus canaliculatus]